MEGSTFWLLISVVAFLLVTFLVSIIRGNTTEKGSVNLIPSPTRLPFIGHLYLLQGNPFVEFTRLGKIYGEIFSLQLGNVPTIVVNSFRLMKQILVVNGGDFGNRANFLRYHVLFGNDKENSLAFCDWSEVQRTRRSLARRFCHTNIYVDKTDDALYRAANWLTKTLDHQTDATGIATPLKMDLNKACAIAFFGFFCSAHYDQDEENEEFDLIVRLFDDIFYEINQGHPTDVLPALTPFFRKHLTNLAGMGVRIREFVVKQIINPHMDMLDLDDPQDFVDILLTHLHESEPESRLTLEQVLYQLEDFIGGHSAVSNLLARALVEIAGVPGLSEKIYQTCVLNENGPYMQAVLYETLRKTSSPIVPHIASKDTKIDDYDVKKGTMIIFNNYDLNTSPQYWQHPEQFIPERFLTESGNFVKPSNFIPFSTGKRACMGYKLVEKTSKLLILQIIRDYKIDNTGVPTNMPISCIALHPEFNLNIRLTRRTPLKNDQQA